MHIKMAPEKWKLQTFNQSLVKVRMRKLDGVTTYIGSVSWAQELSSLPEGVLQQATELQR